VLPLVLENVSKYFSTASGRRAALRGVSFSVPAGGLLCLLGPNGSGKTTLLKSIATLLIPDGGRVRLGDRDVHRSLDWAKRRIGFASTEDQSFYGRLSGRLNLWFYGQMYGMTGAEFDRRLAALDALLDLSGSLDRPHRELSSGQKQRFLLARAALHDPAVLILDEPHQNLDPLFAARLRVVIRDRWVGEQGKTVIVSTHHLEDAEKISDRWVVLAEGKVRFVGSVAAARAADPRFHIERFFHQMTEPVA
jgi:ABC-type multidrug transport system ATPase subunit